MDMTGYEMLRCGKCGKILGHIRLDVKIYPPKFWVRLVAGGPLIKVEKDALCEERFSSR